MHFKFVKAILTSSVVGFVLGLGVNANAVTLTPGTTVLSDTTDFLDIKIDYYAVAGNIPFGQFYQPGYSNPGPLVPLFLGQNWSIFGSRTANLYSTSIDFLVEQATLGSNLAGPNAKLTGSVFKQFPSVLGSGQASYLAGDPAQTFNSVTCMAGSSNCVSYELTALPTPIAPNPPTIFELKGFFNASNLPPVPEGETGIGALAALGLVFLMRARYNASKQLS